MKKVAVWDYGGFPSMCLCPLARFDLHGSLLWIQLASDESVFFTRKNF